LLIGFIGVRKRKKKLGGQGKKNPKQTKEKGGRICGAGKGIKE